LGQLNMVRKTKGSNKKKSATPYQAEHSHLFKKDPRTFRIGQHLPPKRDLYRFVRWPRYIRIQRQRAILKRRLKAPPAIAQFNKTLQGTQAKDVFKLLRHYIPESPVEKRKRLRAAAEAELKEEKKEKKAETSKQRRTKSKSKKEARAKKPLVLRYGINTIASLVQTAKAKLVVIAHDVDPIELVIWLPALCRKFSVPYVIVKGKARLGHLVYQKNASALALTDVRKEHDNAFQNITSLARTQYNDNVRAYTEFGGLQMGGKFQARKKKDDKARADEAAKTAAASK